MTFMTRWSPVRELAALEVDRLNRMFDAAFSGEPLAHGGWIPAVDIYETAEKDVVVKLDLPGVKREDIKVSFENQTLAIEGERKVTADAADQLYRAERGSGAFRRSFTLPASVDGSRVDASYQDGVLTIKLPRREEARPRQIPVNG
jgi:HSP20 family protein